MSKYQLKYTNYMLPQGRIFSVCGITIAFDKNKMVVDVCKEIERQSGISIDNPKFKSKANEVYAKLISDFKCEPYVSIDNAKLAIIDTRNNDLLKSLQDKRDSELEKLRFELNAKLLKMRRELEDDAQALEARLQTDMQASLGEVSKEQAFIRNTDKELQQEIAETEKIKLKEEIAQAQQRVEAFKIRLTRQQNVIASKVNELRLSKENDIKAVQDEYLKIIDDKQKKLDKEIMDKAKFLDARKQEEIAIIDKVINFELPEEKKPEPKKVEQKDNVKKPTKK